jgi:hypothetical protein
VAMGVRGRGWCEMEVWCVGVAEARRGERWLRDPSQPLRGTRPRRPTTVEPRGDLRGVQDRRLRKSIHHCRTQDYMDSGRRIASIPGSMRAARPASLTTI